MNPKYIRNLIKKKRKNKITYGQISEDLNLTRSTVQAISNYKMKINKKKSGPKNKIGKSDMLKIKRFIAKSNMDGLKVNSRRIIEDTNIHVSRHTLNNCLIKNDYHYVKQSQKIQLTMKHKQDRISLISIWIQKNISWETAIFTDEKKFSLDGPDNWY